MTLLDIIYFSIPIALGGLMGLLNFEQAHSPGAITAGFRLIMGATPIGANPRLPSPVWGGTDLPITVPSPNRGG